MTTHNLVNRQVQVEFDSPHFLDRDVATKANIKLIDFNAMTLLLEMIPPVSNGGQVYPLAIARARHAKDTFDLLIKGDGLLCGITCIPADKYNPEKPFDTNWWRGGGAEIASLKLTSS